MKDQTGNRLNTHTLHYYVCICVCVKYAGMVEDKQAETICQRKNVYPESGKTPLQNVFYRQAKIAIKAVSL